MLASAAAHLLLAAQLAQGGITGVVRDRVTDHAVQGAAVLLPDLGRATLTGADGRYRFADLPPGPQHLEVHASGYVARTLHAFVPRSGQLELNLALDPQPLHVAEVAARVRVPVRGAGAEGGRDDAWRRRLSHSALRLHPLQAEADALAAIAGGDIVLRPEAAAGLHVRGGAPDQTSFVLDGIPILSPYHAAGLMGAWNVDAIESISAGHALPSADLPDALSGAVEARTRAAATQLRFQGGVSTTHARMTADAPLGSGSLLFSTRTGFPGSIAGGGESSYVAGEVGDQLVRISVGLLGGELRALAFSNENELSTAATAHADEAVPPAPRNRYEWESTSLGASWARTAGTWRWEVRGWRATATGHAQWQSSADVTRLANRRGDWGLVAAVTTEDADVRTRAGVRWEQIDTRYRADVVEGAHDVRGRHDGVALFADHERRFGLLRLAGSGVLARTESATYFAPRLLADLRITDAASVSLSFARTHQFAQSLRNHESIVGSIFPFDLFVAASRGGVPVARGTIAMLAADWRAHGAQVQGRTWLRSADDVVLVAPTETRPFAAGHWQTGRSRARGVALDAGLSGARFGLVGSYGWQTVRNEYGARRYTPDFYADHSAELGVLAFPWATWSLRAAATGLFGRRGTLMQGGLEWETCNLLDMGCEFAGSPTYEPDDLGRTTLPAYLRLDLGARKHWHWEIRGRASQLALHATLSNLLGRTNILGFVADPVTGEPRPIDMLPFAPLVVGLDWRW